MEATASENLLKNRRTTDDLPTRTRNVVLVLGMHRSGTSALAGMLHRAGLTIPGEVLLPHPTDNPGGYFEARRLVELNDRLLSLLGSDWRTPGTLTEEDYSAPGVIEVSSQITSWLEGHEPSGAPILLKDPRLCRLLPVWLPLLNRAGYGMHAVMIVRDPSHVAASLARRALDPTIAPYALTDPIQSVLLWMDYNIAARQALAAQSTPFITASFSTFMGAPEYRLDLLRGLERNLSVPLDAAAAYSAVQARPKSQEYESKIDLPHSFEVIAQLAKELYLQPKQNIRCEQRLRSLAERMVSKES